MVMTLSWEREDRKNEFVLRRLKYKMDSHAEQRNLLSFAGGRHMDLVKGCHKDVLNCRSYLTPPVCTSPWQRNEATYVGDFAFAPFFVLLLPLASAIRPVSDRGKGLREPPGDPF